MGKVLVNSKGMWSLKKILVSIAIVVSQLLISPSAKASAGKEFIMACTYGVMAGTLVGAATLAFTKNPGDNLNKVARGASLGLYGGILLGIYVVYIVPNQIEEENSKMMEQPLSSDARSWKPKREIKFSLNSAPRVAIAPLTEDGKISGVFGQVEVARF